MGAFLTNPPSRYTDELTAAAFFPVGKWEEARDTEIAGDVLWVQKRVDKQVAHLTISRPAARAARAR